MALSVTQQIVVPSANRADNFRIYHDDSTAGVFWNF